MEIGRLSRWALCPQHALVTLRCFLTYPCAVTHDQGVILIEQLAIVWQAFHEHPAQPTVMEFAAEPSQSLQQAVGVGINDETRLFGGVQQDTVGCLLPDSINRKQLFSECWQFLVKKRVQLIVVVRL